MAFEDKIDTDLEDGNIFIIEKNEDQEKMMNKIEKIKYTNKIYKELENNKKKIDWKNNILKMN